MDAEKNGGYGGQGFVSGNSRGGSGAGNPKGTCFNGNDCAIGQSGTGGLLTIYANEYENKGTISANGATGGKGTVTSGGSSGGGSINIFTNQKTGIDQLGIITNTRYEEIKGSTKSGGGSIVGATTSQTASGGAGGTGTINIGEIRNGQYYDLKAIIEQDKEQYIKDVTIEGESILSILNNNNNLKSGYYYFVANGEKYPVHMITLEGNQHFTENKTFGDAADVATKDDYAQNMVIVKVNGDLEIDSGVTVSPYYTEYGGPKGFTIYVTGKLTNKGTIDNSHGAKAEGQNVYLWKNTDGTYEYVPAEGGSGGARNIANSTQDGESGQNGTGRQTGGGGSGGADGNKTYTYESGSGSAGTSYSGGSGGGGASVTRNWSYIYPYILMDAEKNGGYGGQGFVSGSGSVRGGSGAGNPGGTCFKETNCSTGQNGTGGLLIIYANKYENKGTINAKGYNGGSGTLGGGSSGGGSINIFTNQSIIGDNKGIVNISGGAAVGTTKGGAGGTGTITYTQLQPVTITSNYSYPIISISKNESEQYKITINYFSTLSKKLYSIDNGANWLEYNGSFNVNAGSVVLAKGVNTDKTETEVISYTTPSSNGIPYNTIDGNIESNAVLEINKDYIFTVLEDTIGKNLRFYLGSEPSSDATIKIYDKDNKELLSTTFVNNLTVINIPTNAYKFIINAGSKELTINEINIRKELEKNETIPSISINDVNWTSSKTIEIIYPDGYKNEYSLDLGTTWNEYTEPITVEENTTIFTRVIKDEKVIGSSSFVVTSIDNVEPEISLDIDENLDKGTDIKIPTSYNLGISGGTTICKTGEITVTNINELEVGTHEITCTVTNGANISKNVTKNVIIKEKEEQVIEPTTEETTNP